MGNSPADCSLGGPASRRTVRCPRSRHAVTGGCCSHRRPSRTVQRFPTMRCRSSPASSGASRWTSVRGRTLAVVTERRWMSTTRVQHRDRRRGHRPSRRRPRRLGAAGLPLDGAGSAAPAFGTRQLPATPVLAGERAYGDVVVTRDRVATFVAATGIDHPLHADLDHCRRMGFDDVVVQGLELVDDVVRASGASVGTVEAWFRKAIVAGETVALGSADDGCGPCAPRAASSPSSRASSPPTSWPRASASTGDGAGAVTADPAPVAEPLLVIRDFRTQFLSRSGPLTAVDGVDLSARSRPDARHRRRVGSGKTGAGAVDHGPARRSRRSSARARVRFDGVELGRRPAGHGAGPAGARRWR